MSVVGLLCLGLTMAPVLALHLNRLPAATALDFSAGPAPVGGPNVPTPADDVVSPTTTTTMTIAPVTTTTTTTTTTTAPPSAPASSPRAEQPPPRTADGPASWYKGRKAECAHRSIPLRTVVKVTNLGNGRSTRCTITNRGPYKEGRIIDLSKPAFAALASPSRGVIKVRVDW